MNMEFFHLNFFYKYSLKFVMKCVRYIKMYIQIKCNDSKYL
jgi:hypothetical protein